MTDIIELLKNMNVKDDGGFDRNDVKNQAIETIQNLRQALHTIGYDYVELSYEKVQWLYHDHMKIAKEAYINSFPPELEKKEVVDEIRPFDNNF
jgi:enamine deaminase RidA (YjgF/YER057c/UK114 family)